MIQVFLLSLSTVLISTEGVVADNHRNKLIYILLDGFRYDYAMSQPPEQLPGFTKFISEGVRAEWMTGVYPTLSYPSWTTLVTGQYPETHGIVANFFYDPQDKDFFSLTNYTSSRNSKWWTSEHIWHTATRHNVRTAVYLFGMCSVRFNDVVPEVCEDYKEIINKDLLRNNIDRALDRLDEGFEFIGLYSENVDHNGHKNGPGSEEVKESVRYMDQAVLYLLRQLEERGMVDQVNIIIVSDHGMRDTTPETTQILDLDSYLNPALVENIAERGAFTNIKVPPENIEQVYSSLSQMPDVEVYKKEDIPDHLHFKKGKYVHDIIVKAKPGTWFRGSEDVNKQFPPRTSDHVSRGGHGYDFNDENMRAIFLAKGPDFHSNVKISEMNMVDVYPLLAHLLQVTPGPNNGSLYNLQDALLNYTSNARITTASLSIISTVIILLMLGFDLF